MPAKPEIFISHITSETEFAQLLKDHLTRDFLNFLKVFVSSDGQSIQGGVRWLEKLSDSLQRAQVEIVLCSKESIERPWVNFEAGAGWIRGIPLIPVCHAGLRPYELPVPLNMLQARELNQATDIKKLYQDIAKVIGMDPPSVNFDEIANQFCQLEKEHKKRQENLERIQNPRVLCAASEQYAEFKFELDIATLEKIFPGRVDIETKLTARRLRELLISNKYDILHLVLPVDPENGDLVFSHVDSLQKPGLKNNNIDKISAEGFKELACVSGTSLVTLATCNSIFLGVELSNAINMIATHVEVSGEQVAEWADWFYGLLVKGMPLYKAYELTKSNCSTPMRLIRKKDIAFSITNS